MISSYAQGILARSRGKHILLDSNLLILLLLGSFDIKLIASFKRLSEFSISDFRAIRDLSQSFKIATSSHVLTEVSNLAKDLPQRQGAFRYIATRIAYLKENVVSAVEVTPNPEFSTFGITDAVLASLCDTHVLVTNDGRLAAHLRSKRQSVLTLDDFRQKGIGWSS
jgi:rRNA-processing protein FCF1